MFRGPTDEEFFTALVVFALICAALGAGAFWLFTRF